VSHHHHPHHEHNNHHNPEGMTHDDFGLVTEDEFADAMNVGKMTVAKWRKDGTGPAYTMVGKSVYYQTKNVYAWLDWRTFLSGKSPDEPGARAAA